MANGDIAAQAGLDVLTGTESRRLGYDEINKTRDYVAEYGYKGSGFFAAVTDVIKSTPIGGGIYNPGSVPAGNGSNNLFWSGGITVKYADLLGIYSTAIFNIPGVTITALPAQSAEVQWAQLVAVATDSFTYRVIRVGSAPDNARISYTILGNG